MIDFILAKYHFLAYVLLAMIGVYAMIAKHNFVKKIIGMNIFQTAVFLFYITIGKVAGGTAPIVWDQATAYDNPLPHVLILTAIVVSVSTTAVAFALIIRIHREYGTIEGDQILELRRQESTRHQRK